MKLRISTARKDAVQRQLSGEEQFGDLFFEVDIDPRSGIYVRAGDPVCIGRLNAEAWVHPDDAWKLVGVFDDKPLAGWFERVKEWWHGL